MSVRALWEARLCGCAGEIGCSWCDCMAILARGALPAVVPVQVKRAECVWVGAVAVAHVCDNPRHQEVIALAACDEAYDAFAVAGSDE